jgi:hypothetical protein
MTAHGLAVLFLTVLALGTAASVAYTLQTIYKLIFCQDDSEETSSLLKSAKKSAAQTKTPVFGETEWFLMLISVFWALTFKAGCQNLSKLALQLEWHTDDSTQV